VRQFGLLSIIATIHPEIWDAIIPHGPRALDRAALNPQPLPPQETLLAGAAEMAHEVVRLAVAAEAQGGSSSAFVREIIDDWCGTPWPGKWPWPSPRPGNDGEGPSPEPWDVQTARVVGAVVFASVASRLASGDLRTTFADGADRLAKAALGEGSPDSPASAGLRW
jgi:hypothetical protein